MAVSSSNRRARRWIMLLPVFLGCSITLLKYLGWSAVYSAYYGLPTEVWRVKTAAHWGSIYLWIFLGLSVIAIVGTMILVPFRSERISPGLRGTIRFFAAILIVVLGVMAGAFALTELGHHLK